MDVNFLTGANPNRIAQTVNHVCEKYDEIVKRFKENPFGDGNASQKILEIIKAF